MFVIQGAAVGNVQAPHLHSAARRTDGTGFLDGVLAGFSEDGLVNKGAFDVVEPYSGGDRNAVPLADTEVGHFVTHAFEELPWEVVVLALGFLHGEDVAVTALQPSLHTVGTSAERIYIPGSYLHSH